MNDELRQRLGYPTVRTLCNAVQPGATDFPARCALDKGHAERKHASARYGTEMTTWEDE